MKEIFDLNKLPLGMITPHDCIIKTIHIIGNRMELDFEEGIGAYESIRCYKDNVKSLKMSFNLLEQDFSFYCWKESKSNDLNGCYELLNNLVIQELAQSRLEYISHYIGFNSIILKFFSEVYGNIILDLDVSSVEYKWG